MVLAYQAYFLHHVFVLYAIMRANHTLYSKVPKYSCLLFMFHIRQVD